MRETLGGVDNPVVVVTLSTMALVLVGLAVLTGVGARRRHNNIPLSVVSGLAFPLTWLVWYLRDTRRGLTVR
jgi:hypothetical protein